MNLLLLACLSISLCILSLSALKSSISCLSIKFGSFFSNDREERARWDREIERSCWQKKKRKGRRKKRTKIHKHSKGCSSEEKNRNSGTASETFKERKYREVFNYKMRTLKHFAWRMCCQRILWSWALSFYINCAFGLHLRLGILAFPFFLCTCVRDTMHYSMDPMHCSHDPQILYSEKMVSQYYSHI